MTRLGRGDLGDQGGFADVGKSDQTHVSDELELQDVFLLLARLARFVLAGGAVGRGGEGRVPAAAPAAAGGEKPLAGFEEIEQDRFIGRVLDDGPQRDGEGQVRALAAVAVAALAVAAVLGLVDGMEPEVGQGLDARVGGQDDAPAVSAPAAVRTAPGDAPLAAEAQAAVPPAAGAEADLDPVDEHRSRRRTSAREHATEFDRGLGPTVGRGRLNPVTLLRQNRNELACPALILELHHAGRLGEQGVVLAAADVSPALQGVPR